MLNQIKDEFPELFTKKGTLSKAAPKRYICACGNQFNKTKSISFGGIGFAIPTCDNCYAKAKESIAYIIWTRMSNNQIEHEDFILELAKDRLTIEKSELQDILAKHFPKYDGKALSHLVYYGYLKVDIEKRDNFGIIEYSLNANKDRNKRYERI